LVRRQREKELLDEVEDGFVVQGMEMVDKEKVMEAVVKDNECVQNNLTLSLSSVDKNA